VDIRVLDHLIVAGERCQISSSTGANLLNLEAAQLEADACGISHPERVMGQQWPSFESNQDHRIAPPAARGRAVSDLVHNACVRDSQCDLLCDESSS
jgi:hypothetical protein